MDEQIHAYDLVEKWADDEFYQDFAESHGAVLRNFARWFMKRGRAIIEAAADRHCVKTCKPEGYKDSDYHCRICPDRRAILGK